jgi:Domain of unknown function (DUF4157)/Microbial transglutaminase
MHDQQHRPPLPSERSPEPTPSPRQPVRRPGAHGAGPPATVQRAAAPGGAATPSAPDAAPAGSEAAPEAAPDAKAAAAAPAGLIVEDTETKLEPGQMRKSAFLGALRPAVDQAVDDGYTGTLDRIAARVTVAARFAMYSAEGARALEQTIHREAPGGGGRSAAGYIPAVVGRVKREIAADVADKTKKDEPKDGGTGGGLFFKAREGGPRGADDPRAVKAQLQGGEPLDSGVRSGLEAAMGQDFSGVRVHTGATAAQLSTDLNARAFTVGRDVAFGAGEYHPGTPVGDALIAHELAHVVQQGHGADAAVAPKSEAAHDGPLEAAADESAMGAVLSIWGGIKAGALGIARSAGTNLRSGLKLQRCPAGKKEPEVKGPAVRPGMGVVDPLKPGEESKSIPLDEYIAAWERHQGHSMSADQRKMLAKGCVGITDVNLGGPAANGRPDSSDCYDTFEHATARADELEKQKGSRPFIFSQRFWSDNLPYTPDPVTGKIDMSPYKAKPKPKPGGTGTYVNFDYGWYDETTKSWFHANHCDPATGSANCSRTYDPDQRMKVYQSTKDHYSRPLQDFDKQVYCVAWSKVP